MTGPGETDQPRFHDRLAADRQRHEGSPRPLDEQHETVNAKMQLAQMDTSDWFFDELAHAGDERLDADYAAGYDRKAGLDVAAEITLLRDLGLDEQSTLVDLGVAQARLRSPLPPIADA